ncbi:MAG: ABC transporter ATP-binding protein [Acidimicrobiia bacterium]
MPAVEVYELRKIFKVPVRDAGLGASVRSLVRRETREVPAVDGISFHLRPGEVVGFLGPNGAGKTTTLKMLSGLLHPDGGRARVLGHEPWRREKAFLRRITLVMGNRQGLAWDLPALDSFELHRAVYAIARPDFERAREEFVELLELGDVVRKPVRNLSLGERMKVEMVANLLHRPEVLFLDEPTLGLDVTMQKRIRRFVADYNRRFGATVLLTSHYMADVVALCERVIVIHRGRLLYDGALAGLAERFATNKTITITAPDLPTDLSGYGEVIERSPDKAVLRMAKPDVSRVAARLLGDLQVTDLTVEDPPIEDVIEEVFASSTEEAPPS